MTITTHVLDAVLGTPAAGMTVRLDGPGTSAEAVTDRDGRVRSFEVGELAAGTYRLTFATAPWFLAGGRETFYPEIVVSFAYTSSRHVHVPVLLSPFSYTTYRGS
jgi:5-hydroxyisourate hydrolase